VTVWDNQQVAGPSRPFWWQALVLGGAFRGRPRGPPGGGPRLGGGLKASSARFFFAASPALPLPPLAVAGDRAPWPAQFVEHAEIIRVSQAALLFDVGPQPGARGWPSPPTRRWPTCGRRMRPLPISSARPSSPRMRRTPTRLRSTIPMAGRPAASPPQARVARARHGRRRVRPPGPWRSRASRERGCSSRSSSKLDIPELPLAPAFAQGNPYRGSGGHAGAPGTERSGPSRDGASTTSPELKPSRTADLRPEGRRQAPDARRTEQPLVAVGPGRRQPGRIALGGRLASRTAELKSGVGCRADKLPAEGRARAGQASRPTSSGGTPDELAGGAGVAVVQRAGAQLDGRAPRQLEVDGRPLWSLFGDGLVDGVGEGCRRRSSWWWSPGRGLGLTRLLQPLQPRRRRRRPPQGPPAGPAPRAVTLRPPTHPGDQHGTPPKEGPLRPPWRGAGRGAARHQPGPRAGRSPARVSCERAPCWRCEAARAETTCETRNGVVMGKLLAESVGLRYHRRTTVRARADWALGRCRVGEVHTGQCDGKLLGRLTEKRRRRRKRGWRSDRIPSPPSRSVLKPPSVT